jgi:hypothetical protein
LGFAAGLTSFALGIVTFIAAAFTRRR